MSENSKIEWTDHTFNAWEGCQKVGPGCDHCYAEARNARFGGGTAVNWGPGAPRRRTSAANWRKPLTWNAREFFQCNDCGHRGFGRPYLDVNPGTGGVLGDGHECEVCRSRDIESVRMRVFCASLADVFDNAAPAAWRRDLAALIEATPALDWLLLTKRIGNAAAMLVDMFPAGAPDHVWLGATVVNQAEADRDVPKLLATPARVRFLSIEPMLGQVDIARWLDPTGVHCMDVCADTRYVKAGEVETYTADGESVPLCPACGESASWTGYDDGIDWVIAGGESGPAARPAHPDWFRSLRDQCAEASVPFLFKQWGEWHTGARLIGSGEPVFRQFGSHQQWVNKATTWVNGGICLDRYGSELRNGGDFMRARDNGLFPVTIMHRVGKRAAGRLLDGVEHNGFPAF
ncbi:phage Gp37/Gp68 family protein [Burkholderia gladioli]|uniref:phage Gp37/Gp68 family protein n=1 Tax=Burkholderia gladioli TaxID=28095 RepID=UPI001641FB30|nr:phage Gp37/Gp68 family protein [Burkholderia gladioli]